MRSHLLAFAVASVMVSAAPAMGADALFSSTIEDLPLMEGMVEHGDGVQFSTSAGRIAEVVVDAPYSRAEVLSYYQDTLPQLGWTVVSDTAYAREGETLKLSVEVQGSEVAVHFVLAPQ